MASIVTPISHLFKREEDAKQILAHSDFLECRDHSPEFEVRPQILFHTDLQPAHKLSEEDFIYLEKVKKEKPNLALVSFHLASCYHSPLIENAVFVPGGHRYEVAELLANAAENLEKIKTILGANIKIAIENNNYYQTPAYDYITEPAFISEIINTNQIFFLYDIAHAKVSSHNAGSTYETYKASLPLNRAAQIHICKSGIKDGKAYDAHFSPDEQEWNEVTALLAEYNTIEYLTIEYYKDFSGLLTSLQELKKRI